MIIFFEEYQYNYELLNKYLDDTLYSRPNKDRLASTPYVGYYYSQKINDSIFILPKVFLNKDENGVLKAFGQYDPEAIIKMDLDSELYSNDLKEVIFSLSTWIYRAIAHYVEEASEENITYNSDIQNVIDNRGDSSSTSLDIILQLLKFNQEHRSLLAFVLKNSMHGNNKINWKRTINHSSPLIKDNKPIYFDIWNKEKAIDYDEELISLFYSVLEYLKKKYNFKISSNLNYKLINPRKIEELIDEQKGVRFLVLLRNNVMK